jgi:hypothetical protein
MRQPSIAFLICTAVLAWAQDHVTVVAPSAPSTKGPLWKKATVEGRTDKNSSLGIELSPAPGLEFGAPELKGNPATVPLLVTINALGQPSLFSARQEMFFYSDALAYYPENRRSTDDYIRRVVIANQKEGFAPFEGSSEEKLSGVTFARKNFQNPPIHEAVLVKACKAQALVLIFAGSDQDVVNKLIAGTELKLDRSIRRLRDVAPDLIALHNVERKVLSVDDVSP